MPRYTTQRDLERFLRARSLNLYTGFGVVWDEDERVLAGGERTWWAKLVPDTAHGGGKARAVAVGLGDSLAEAVEAARCQVTGEAEPCGYCGSTRGLDDGESAGWPACLDCGGV